MSDTVEFIEKNPTASKRNTLRLIVELGIQAVLLFLIIQLNSEQSNTMYYIALIVLGAWSLTSLSRFNSKRKVLKDQKLVIGKDKIGFKSLSRNSVFIEPRNLKIGHVKKKNGRVVSIALKSRGVNVIWIEDYKNMDDIFALISKHIRA